MENLFIVTNPEQLNKIFETSQDKLVVLMFYTKNNPDCRRGKSTFETIALNHSISIFCIVDIDKFEGTSRFITNTNIMPHFDCYHMGTIFGTFGFTNQRDMEINVRSGEQHVMTQNNMKQMNSMGMPNSQLLVGNNANNMPQATQNYYKPPPMMSQQQQLMMDQYRQQMMSQPIPQLYQPQPPDQKTQFVLPTLQQMQQMFQIFQMMQQMGVLNTKEPVKEPEKTPDNIISLPNGDKLIPLADGNYGLIKSQNG